MNKELFKLLTRASTGKLSEEELWEYIKHPNPVVRQMAALNPSVTEEMHSWLISHTTFTKGERTYDDWIKEIGVLWNIAKVSKSLSHLKTLLTCPHENVKREVMANPIAVKHLVSVDTVLYLKDEHQHALAVAKGTSDELLMELAKSRVYSTIDGLLHRKSLSNTLVCAIIEDCLPDDGGEPEQASLLELAAWRLWKIHRQKKFTLWGC